MDKLLARSGLLDGIDEKDLTHLFGCTGGRERSFSAGEPICEEGGRPSVCVLLAGCAASVPDGMSRVFEPGDVFCAMALPSVPGRLHALWCSARTVFVVCAALHAPITAGWSKILQV